MAVDWKQVYKTEIGRLELDSVPQRLLYNNGFKTLPQLCGATEARLLKIRGFGRKSLYNVRVNLDELGLSLNSKPSRKLLKEVRKKIRKRWRAK